MNKVVLVIGFILPSFSLAQAINKDDFAYGIDVKAEANSYYEMDITDELYAGIQSPDLHDLRVFGPDGNSVPYLIKRQKQQRSTTESSKIQTFFPVSAPVELTQSDNVRVIINHGGGMSIDMQTNTMPRSEIKDTTVFYVVDLGEERDKHIKFLQLQWNDSVVERAKISISTSSDLHHWQRVGQSTLVSLYQGADKLRHDTIEMNSYDRYLKIVSDQAAEFRLTRLNTISRQEVGITQKPIWIEVAGTNRGNNEYYYVMPGNFPIDFLEITPATPNTVHNISMRSGLNDKEFRQTRFRGYTYSIKVGEEMVRSDPVSVFGTTDRHWLLKVFDKDNTAAPMPSVKIGRYPHVVHFVSSTPGVYTVAYGSAGITHQGALLPSALLKNQYTPVRIESGQPRSLGGVEQLAPLPDRSRYAKWALWGILSITLLVVGYMALRLLRHMNNGDSQ